MLDNRLETLLTVAETCSFTRAAEKLSLTQPAVSHQIGQLEKELGAPLFRRRKNGLMLTKEGEIVLDLTGKRNGRGAYLCRKTACLKKARKGNRIGRELGVEISEEVYDALEKEMEADAGA